MEIFFEFRFMIVIFYFILYFIFILNFLNFTFFEPKICLQIFIKFNYK